MYENSMLRAKLKHLIALFPQCFDDDPRDDGTDKTTCQNDNIDRMQSHDLMSQGIECISRFRKVLKKFHFIDNQDDNDRINDGHQPRHP